jgi:formylglycine-generating enzyme required for sulfatase activity
MAGSRRKNSNTGQEKWIMKKPVQFSTIQPAIVLTILLFLLCPAQSAFASSQEMVYIPGGTFQMGDSFTEGWSHERPVHTVTVDSFYMGRYEVTNGQYCQYLNSALGSSIYVSGGVVYGSGNNQPYCDTSTSNSYIQISYSGSVFSVRTKGGRSMSNDPMVEVSWFGAAAYCNWRSQQEGKELCYNLSTWNCDFTKKGYRLPTEAEWEYAARGGLSSRRFPWGDTITHSQANYDSDSRYSYDISPTRGYHPTWNDGIYPFTSPVGSFAANNYGLYDMAGNVWEWCNDWYGAYSSNTQTNPTGPTSGSYRDLRGGGWYEFADSCRVAYRVRDYPHCQAFGHGFRLALKAEGPGTGMLYGIVRDQQIGTSITGAEVFVAGMPHLTAKSDDTGHYGIVGVPYNTLFTLVASASGYKTSYTNNVQVTEANPFKTVYISLTPSPWQYLKLIELNPNPNSNPLKIMRGGIGHRYYQVVDEDSNAVDWISVATSPPLHSPFFSRGTIRKGVVSIDVNSLEVTDGQTITITHLNGTALEPAKQKSFVVQIEPLTQEKIWELRTAAELGISHLSTEAEGTLEVHLRDEQSGDGIPELISLSRKALLGSGLEYSPAGVAAYCRVSNLVIGGRAGVSVKGIVGKTVREQFGYGYNTNNLNDNVAKLYFLLYPAPVLSPPELMTIRAGLEAMLFHENCEELEAGLYIKGAGSAQAGLGIPVLELASYGFVDFEAELEAIGKGTLLWRHKDDTISLVFEVIGDFHGQVGAGVGGIPLWMASGSIFQSVEYSGGLISKARLELVYNPSLSLKEIKVALDFGTQVGESRDEKQTEWVISGPSQNLEKLISPSGIFEMLAKAIVSAQAKPVEVTPTGVIREIDTLFQNAQRDLGLVITYEVKLLPAHVVDVPFFAFDLGGSLVIRAEINAEAEGEIIETKDLIIEKGRCNGIQLYPTESYSKDIYNPINITLADVYTKALTDVGGSAIQSILNYGQQIVQAGQEVILNAGNSILHIGADVLEAGQKIFNVFEAQFGKEMMALSADSNMPLENKYFGIGGTYRLEPADLNLPSPATFTISYSDSDVGFKDESSFRIYRWNDSTGKWVFIGGTVDTVNNTVTTSINSFGTYAIGARVEYGNFMFTADPNTAPADGNSIVKFTSEQLRNNDGTPVANNTLFTVATSGGTIITADANTVFEGTQVATQGGIIQFDLKAPQIAMKAKAEAISLNRMAIVTGDVTFTDINAPQAPTGVKVEIGQGKIFLSWDKNTEIDLAGYKIYFDDDQNGPPYNGVAYYSGQNSPIDVADANSHFLRGLQSAHRYYVAVTAYDVVGNESPFSREIIFYNTLPPDSDSDGMPDSWEIKYAEAANGLIPTADDGMLDNDGDGLTNFEEYMSDNNPLKPDSDNDGIKDVNDLCPNTDPNMIVDANGCPIGDFDLDGKVGLPDLYNFISHWLDADCSVPDWCKGTDFDMSTIVDFVDFAFLAHNWSGKATPKGDISLDGIIDYRDLLIFSEQWLMICSGPTWCEGCDFDKSSFVDFADFAIFCENWLWQAQP